MWTSASVVDEHVADVVVGGSCALGAESDAVTIVDRCGEYFAEMGCCGVFDELLGAFDDDDHHELLPMPQHFLARLRNLEQ